MFPEIPKAFADLTDEALNDFIEESERVAIEVSEHPENYVTEERRAHDVLAEARSGREALILAREERDRRGEAAAETETPEPELSVDDDEFRSELAELRALAEDDEEEREEEEEPEGEAAAAVEPEPVAEEEKVPEATSTELVAGAATDRRRNVEQARRKLPARSRAAVPTPAEEERVSLLASAAGAGVEPGSPVDAEALARLTIYKRGQMGKVAPGESGTKIPLAHASWEELYPEPRRLGGKSEAESFSLIKQVVDEQKIQAAMRERFQEESGSLTASGGLCAPVTPYYNLQMISTADRPVRAALPGFGADRGGINAAAPASLAAIDDGIGLITAADDAAGGTFATKTCQVIDCPDFSETDVAIIYHCLQFGNLGARTFPELVAQWNDLTMAALARSAETALLDGISAASDAVTAANLGLGATASLPSQVLAAAVGMRSRHRMDKDAVLRALFPFWVLELLVSDMYRTQFDRFDMTREDFVRVLRSANIEPSFYLDSATGAGQVFGTQGPGVLDGFPPDVVWYLFPEGSFLYLDGGTLELGIVRDSVLNSTNDFQIFGEMFENVAFVGIESLEVTSTVCDSGTVSMPDAVACPINYADNS